MKKVTIPNWSQFEVKVAGVCLYRLDEDDEPTYQAAFTLFLDNGTESPTEENQQVITIMTDNASSDPHVLAVETANLASALWEAVSNDVPVIDEDGEVYQTLELSKIADKTEMLFH